MSGNPKFVRFAQIAWEIIYLETIKPETSSHLVGQWKTIGKKLKLELILARRLWLLDTLLVLRTKTVQCPLGLEIIKGHRVEGERRVARQTLTRLDSSLPTPNCASCHKKDKELLKLSFVLFAYSFILQMLFLCHFPLNVISYFRTCGWFVVLFRFWFDVRALSQSECTLLPTTWLRVRTRRPSQNLIYLGTRTTFKVLPSATT